MKQRKARNDLDERIDGLAIGHTVDSETGGLGVSGGPIAATTVEGGMCGNCSRTCSATDPLVTRIALIRPLRTSFAMRSVTGTPTVRYATTLRTRWPASVSIPVSTGLAVSLRSVRMSRGSGSRSIICSARPAAELSRSGTRSTRYPTACSAAAVVSPTAATFVCGGMTAR